MNKRETKITTLVALIIGVVALTIGFAAFSRNLTIASSAGYTTSETDIDVKFYSGNSGNTVSPTTTGGATATSLTINSSNSLSISGISVTFTGESQKAVYDFYIKNNSNYTAYLTDATMAAPTGATNGPLYEGIVCSAATNTDGSATNATLVTEACKAIKYTLSVKTENTGNMEAYGDFFYINGGSAALSGAHIDGQVIPAKGSRKVRLTIEYTDESTAAIPDGNFNVNIGTLTLTYSTQDR